MAAEFHSAWGDAFTSQLHRSLQQYQRGGLEAVEEASIEQMSELASHNAAVGIANNFTRDGPNAEYLRNEANRLGRPTSMVKLKSGQQFNTRTLPSSYQNHRTHNNGLDTSSTREQQQTVTFSTVPPRNRPIEQSESRLKSTSKRLFAATHEKTTTLREGEEAIDLTNSSPEDGGGKMSAHEQQVYAQSTAATATSTITPAATKSRHSSTMLFPEGVAAGICQKAFGGMPTNPPGPFEHFGGGDENEPIDSDLAAALEQSMNDTDLAAALEESKRDFDAVHAVELYRRMIDRSCDEEGAYNANSDTAANELARGRTAHLLLNQEGALTMIGTMTSRRTETDNAITSPQAIQKYDYYFSRNYSRGN